VSAGIGYLRMSIGNLLDIYWNRLCSTDTNDSERIDW
jgi:hypothetical protein